MTAVIKVRRLLRRAAMGVLEHVAPETWADLQWARTGRDGASVAATASTEPRIALPTAGEALPDPVTPPSWRAATDLPTLWESCDCRGKKPVLVHAADYPNNGISLFTALTLADHPHLSLNLYGPGGPLRSALAEAQAISFNRASEPASVELFILGNSPDHVGVLKELVDGASRRRREGVRTALYLHDVSLKYLLELHFGSTANDYLRFEYGSGIDRMHDSTLRLLMGASGVRLIARLGGADVIVCHGEAVAGLIEEELAGLGRDIAVRTLGHPLFDDPPVSDDRVSCCPDRSEVLDLMRRSSSGERIVGSFGIPYDWKRPADVAAACEGLFQDGDIDAYVFAGWDAEGVLPNSVMDGAGVVVLSATCTPCLIDVMRSVKVAVQLRRALGGEASGVVAQLSLLGTRVISSFTLEPQRSEAVRGLSVHASVQDIRRAIQAELAEQTRHPRGPAQGSGSPTDLGKYKSELFNVIDIGESSCA